MPFGGGASRPHVWFGALPVDVFVVREAGVDDLEESALRFVGKGHIGFDHGVAAVLQGSRRRPGGFDTIRIDWQFERSRRHQADAQPSRVGADLLDERCVRSGGVIPAAGVGSAEQVQHGGGVRDVAGEHPLDRAAFPGGVTGRDPTTADLEPHQPAARRRDTY